jgi:hypothetical protein
MISYKWSILEVFSEDGKITQAKFHLKASDAENSVDTEFLHTYKDGSVVKPYAETKEEDLIRWAEQDTTQDEVNPIKLNLENQLKALKSSKKSEFPWLADTFTVG